MSAVDLSKAKSGDTVHFRCGGSSVILMIKINDASVYIYLAKGHGESFTFDGDYSYIKDDHPFDIVRIVSEIFTGVDLENYNALLAAGSKLTPADVIQIADDCGKSVSGMLVGLIEFKKLSKELPF